MCGVKNSVVQAALTRSRAESKTLAKNTISDNNIQRKGIFINNGISVELVFSLQQWHPAFLHASSFHECEFQAGMTNQIKLGRSVHSELFNDRKTWFLTAYKYLTLFLTNFKALLSLPILSNSIHRFSYGANPTTSRTRSRMNLTLLLPTWKNKCNCIVKKYLSMQVLHKHHLHYCSGVLS